MSWAHARNVYVPFLPAILFLLSPSLFAEQSPLADSDLPVVAEKPHEAVVALRPTLESSAGDLIAQADAQAAPAAEAKKEEPAKDAKPAEAKPADAKPAAKDDKADRKPKARPSFEEIFKKLDANGDGSLSKDEFKASMDKMHERMSKMRGHRGHGFGKGVGAHGRRGMGMHRGSGRHRDLGMHGSPGRHRGFARWGGRGGDGAFAMRDGGRRHDFGPGGRGGFGRRGAGFRAMDDDDRPRGMWRNAMRDRDRDDGPRRDWGPPRDGRGPERDGKDDDRRGHNDDRIEKLEKKIDALQKAVEALTKAKT